MCIRDRCQNRRKAIYLGMHAFTDEVCRQLRVDDRQDGVNKSKTTMNTIHRTSSDVTWTCRSDEAGEGCKSLDFRPCCVQKWCCQDVHSLNVANRSAICCRRSPGVRELLVKCTSTPRWTVFPSVWATGEAQWRSMADAGWTLPSIHSCFMCIL